MRYVVLACLLLAACASAPRPDVFVIGMEPIEGGALEQRVRVDLRVQNPTREALAVTGMSVKLTVNGQPLARGVSNAAFSVPPLGEAKTSIVTSTTLIDLIRQVVGLQGRGTPSFDYRLEGTLYTGGALGRSLPFESQGTLAPPQQ